MKAPAILPYFLSLTLLCAACDGGGTLAPRPEPPPPGNDSTAADIALSDIAFDQVFQPSLLDYTATVSLLDSTTTITATPSDANATITVNGIDLGAGVESDKITLNEGSNTITVVITAEDGVTSTIYTIDVTRQTAASLAQMAYIKGSNTAEGDVFSQVVLDGDTLVVGARGEDSNATGVDGDQGNNEAVQSGAVYVFTRDASGVWSQQAYIKSSNTDVRDGFGLSLALSGDTLAVGAYTEDSNATGIDGDQADNSASSAGAVYVFTRDGAGVWSQQAYIKASNTETADGFGLFVALDGDTLAVGAQGEDSSATGVNGDESDNAASWSGAVYVFVRDAENVWGQQAYIKASNAESQDGFGRVALHGDTLAVGAWAEDSGATGVDGDEADNSASNSGAVYVFVRDADDVWGQQAYIKASNADVDDWFGRSLALDGDTLAVGAYREDSSAVGIDGDEADNSASASGAVYVYTRDGSGAWSQQAYLKASNTDSQDNFGEIALDGDTLLVGARLEDSTAAGVNGDQLDNSVLDSGAVYVFSRDADGIWSQIAYVKASNPDFSDDFGNSVAVDGDIIAVGATWEDSIATGIDGDQADNTAFESGAVYAFQ